jgi:hypothetical protein
VENWRSFAPTLNGEPLPHYPDEISRSLAIAPDGDRFVLGAEWSLHAFDKEGRQLWNTLASSTAWSVTISGDGRTVVAGLGDGTIRWYDMEDGRELLAFFPHSDGERWVAWAPEGFFTASERGAELIGYHINRGWDRPADFVRIDQLFERYYRPDLIAHRLDRNEAPIQIALAEVGNVDALLLSTRPPSIELVGPEVVAIDHRQLVHEIALRDEGGGIGEVVYRVNGVRIDPVDTRTEERRRGNLILRKQPLDLQQGRNVIEARAYTKDGAVASAPVQQVAEVDDPLARPPTLYGLAIGIDDYFDSTLGLRFAANDARTVKRTLEERGRRLFADVDIRLLSDRQASKEGIHAVFRDLAASVGPNDVFVLYISGHGFADQGRYYFVPQEVGYTNAAALRAGSLSEDDLVGLLEGIKAQKSLVVLDTCYAGAFDTIGPLPSARGLEEKAAIDRLMRATGRAFLGASTDRDLALEGYQGHGLYTYTLIAGMRGEADRRAGNRNGAVNVLELALYLDDLVPDLSRRVFGRTQVPMHQLSGQSFAVTVAE